MPVYKHIFFDLDHTLWDFEANSRKTIFGLFEARSLANRLDCEPQTFYDKYIEINDSKWALYRHGMITKERLRAERFVETFAAFGFSEVTFAEAFEKEYLGTCPYQSALVPGALDAVQYLSNRYNLSIITNGFYETQLIKLKESQLAPYFERVFASDKMGVNKPNRKIFTDALRQAGANRKGSIMIGDSLVTDILGAKQCGMAQVFYNPQNQSHAEKITFEISRLLHLKDIL